MTYEEAVSWLLGDRSIHNSMDWSNPNSEVICAQADAARTQQAYWIVKAHNEGLIKDDLEDLLEPKN